MLQINGRTGGHTYERLDGHTDIRNYSECDNFFSIAISVQIWISGINNQPEVRFPKSIRPNSSFNDYDRWKHRHAIHNQMIGLTLTFNIQFI